MNRPTQQQSARTADLGMMEPRTDMSEATGTSAAMGTGGNSYRSELGDSNRSAPTADQRTTSPPITQLKHGSDMMPVCPSDSKT